MEVLGRGQLVGEQHSCYLWIESVCRKKRLDNKAFFMVALFCYQNGDKVFSVHTSSLVSLGIWSGPFGILTLQMAEWTHSSIVIENLNCRVGIVIGEMVFLSLDLGTEIGDEGIMIGFGCRHVIWISERIWNASANEIYVWLARETSVENGLIL